LASGSRFKIAAPSGIIAPSPVVGVTDPMEKSGVRAARSAPNTRFKHPVYRRALAR